MSDHDEEEDGMGFAGLLPSKRDKHEDALHERIRSLSQQLTEVKAERDALQIQLKRITETPSIKGLWPALYDPKTGTITHWGGRPDPTAAPCPPQT